MSCSRVFAVAFAAVLLLASSGAEASSRKLRVDTNTVSNSLNAYIAGIQADVDDILLGVAGIVASIIDDIKVEIDEIEAADVDEWTDKAVDAVQEAIDGAEDAVNEAKDKVDDSLSAAEVKVNNAIADANERIEKMLEDLDEKIKKADETNIYDDIYEVIESRLLKLKDLSAKLEEMFGNVEQPEIPEVEIPEPEIN